MNQRPKILFVAWEWPCPPRQGSHLRIVNIVRQLQVFGDVTFVCVCSDTDSSRSKETRSQLGSVITCKIHKQQWPGVLEVLRHKFCFHWPWHYGDQLSSEDKKRFAKLCEQYDLVWFHTLNAADAFGQRSYPHSVIDLDDLNQFKFLEMGRFLGTLRTRIAGAVLAFKWRRREKRALDRFSIISLCSEQDKQQLGGSERIAVIPNGFEMPTVKPQWNDRTRLRLGFIGLLGYAPNLYGMKWFAENVWPLVKKQIPNAILRIVGHVDPSADFSGYPGFEHTGFLPDPTDEFASWSGMIVPLHFGGGTRIKILEAFSRMCPVISTPVGAHGLDLEDRKQLIIGKNPDEFADGCIELLTKPDLGKHLASQAWDSFETRYNWTIIGRAIRETAERAMKS